MPWTFKGEKKPYLERRRLRYALQDYMAEAIPFQAYGGKCVLEVGSGSGIDSAEFGRNGAEVVSLDFTEVGSRGTLDTLREAGVVPNVVRASAQCLPFREAVFDCVYSFGVLHHIPDVSRSVLDISRVLKPDCDFVGMVYNKNSLLYAYSILFLHKDEGGNEEELVSKYSERVEKCPYTKAYTEAEIQDLLSARFDAISIRVRFNAIDVPGERKVKIELPDTVPLGWHLIVIAKNKPKGPNN